MDENSCNRPKIDSLYFLIVFTKFTPASPAGKKAWGRVDGQFWVKAFSLRFLDEFTFYVLASFVGGVPSFEHGELS